MKGCGRLFSALLHGLSTVGTVPNEKAIGGLEEERFWSSNPKPTLGTAAMSTHQLIAHDVSDSGSLQHAIQLSIAEVVAYRIEWVNIIQLNLPRQHVLMCDTALSIFYAATAFFPPCMHVSSFSSLKDKN